ncbi:hypothetical protein AVEN_24211-1 [Araneus ventricosus]|uniref:Uncharacterized protein n=1 Tax=Araneus ventricosus TaxID=182803 RepID=A0A4Y2GX31_ARAVE|nr:hypothetical protein AVEN_24211-1 [Araneus ventricosus]
MPILYLFLPPSPSCRKFHSIVPCRKFHSSQDICLLPSTWLLSAPTVKRTLPKSRTFIYAMEATKRKRVLLAVEQKFQIVSRIEAVNGKSAKLRKTMRIANDELDNVLYKWFIQKSSANIGEMIQPKVLNLNSKLRKQGIPS